MKDGFKIKEVRITVGVDKVEGDKASQRLYRGDPWRCSGEGGEVAVAAPRVRGPGYGGRPRIGLACAVGR